MRAGASDPSAPVAGVVAVGDELLYGQTLDGNGSWLSGQLSMVGFDVVRRWVVGDDAEELKRVVGNALRVSDVVVVTGGLGPTPDDLTRDAVAGLLDLPLDMDPSLLRRLEDRFRTRGIETLPPGSQVMAQVPRGAQVLPNPVGAAPGLALTTSEGTLCILLPGVPREMRGIFQSGVVPLLKGRFAGVLRRVAHKIIHTFGVPESVLMTELRAVLPGNPDGVSLAYLPDQLGVRLRLSARGIDGGRAPEEKLEWMESLLHPVLSKYRYEAESGDLAEAVGDALVATGATLAVAESCTGGLVCKRMTDIPGSSGYFLGGVVAYANEVKVNSLGVDPAILDSGGVVSEAVAIAMARGAAEKFGASVGVGITGVAGPGGGSEDKPVGTVCYAVLRGDDRTVRTDLFLGDREVIRARAAHTVLGSVLRILRGERGDDSV